MPLLLYKKIQDSIVERYKQAARTGLLSEVAQEGAAVFGALLLRCPLPVRPIKGAPKWNSGYNIPKIVLRFANFAGQPVWFHQTFIICFCSQNYSQYLNEAYISKLDSQKIFILKPSSFPDLKKNAWVSNLWNFFWKGGRLVLQSV